MAYQTIRMILIRVTTTFLSINLTQSPEVKSKIKKSKGFKTILLEARDLIRYQRSHSDNSDSSAGSASSTSCPTAISLAAAGRS
jgi:hypothetical protein